MADYAQQVFLKCGLVARCAQEKDDGGQVRFDKLCQIVSQCQFGIHDLSRTTLDSRHRLPRFNMPLELGLFLGARRYGVVDQRKKVCLILDRDRYRYQIFCSDIAGQDIPQAGARILRLTDRHGVALTCILSY